VERDEIAMSLGALGNTRGRVVASESPRRFAFA